MNWYRIDSSEKKESRQSKDYAFPLLVSYSQIACVLWFIHISLTAEGFDGLMALLPYSILMISIPVSLFTSLYYYTHYKDDPVFKKFIVCTGLVLGIGLLTIKLKGI